MRILVFGDIHGRSVWKEVIAKEGIENLDLIIFLGDYFTSREGISENDQVRNFIEIVDFLQDYPDKVVLLRGNHDMEALGYEWAYCSPSFRGLWVSENEEYFLALTQWCLQIDNVLFSHAGITKRWWSDMKERYPEFKDFNDINTVSPSEMFGFRSSKFSDYYGETPTQPLTWVRPWCLTEYGFPEITYVVGHTTQDNISNYKQDMAEKHDLAEYAHCDIWCCDTLPRQYLIIDKGEFIPKNVKEL